MGIMNVLKPLADKKSFFKGLIRGLIVGFVYLFFAFLLVFLSSKPANQGYTFDYAMFSFVKSLYQFPLADLLLFAGIVFSSVLLFANYNYWKCSSEKVGKVGLSAGAFALSCPACLLPLLGAVSFSTIALQLGYIVKIGALLLVIAGTYYVANKRTNCKLK